MQFNRTSILKQLLALVIMALVFAYQPVSANKISSLTNSDTVRANSVQPLLIHMMKNVRYPASSRNNGITGTLAVSFDVTADGMISNIVVKKPLITDCDAEIVRVLKSFKDKLKVKAGIYTLPVTFVLGNQAAPGPISAEMKSAWPNCIPEVVITANTR